MIDTAKLPPRIAEVIELLALNAARIAAADACRIEVDCAGGNVRLRVHPAPPALLDVRRSLSRRGC